MSRNTIVAKFASVAVALAMVLTVFAVQPVQAQTNAELEAQIQSLLATIAALQAQISGSTATTCPALTQPLTIGSQGPSVVALQNYLTGTGHFTFSGGSTGYFGPITQSAVASWQASNGVSPAVGYWGPISLARYNAVCMPTPAPAPGDDDDDDDDDDVSGTEGSMTVTRGSASSASVDLGEEEDIYSVDIEANDSDMEVNRIDFEFDKRPWLYIDELMLTVGNQEIAAVNLSSSNVTEVGSDWRVRFTGLDLVIDEGDEVEVVLWAVTPDSLPGTRAAETLTVHMPDDGVRATDGAGLIHYEPSGDLATRSFTFDENFGLGDIDLSEVDNPIETGIIVVSSTTETEGVEVLMFEVEADNGSVTVEEIYVEATTTTADADNVISELCLFAGSVEIDCATVTEATTALGTNRGVATGITAGEFYVLFDDLEFDMDADEEVIFTVEASFNEADGNAARYSAGDTVELTLNHVGGFNGDFENTAETSTIGSGEVFTLLTEGIFVEGRDQSTPTVSQIGDTAEERGTFTMRFDVTAIEEDAWIHQNVVVDATATSGVEFDVVGDSYTGTTTSSLTCSGCTTSGSTFFKVSKGTTRSFTATVVLNPASDGIYGLELESVFFGSAASVTPTHTEVAVPDTSDFETTSVFIAG